MDLNVRVDVNFARVDVNFSDSHSVNIFFFILIPIDIKVLLIRHTNFSLIYLAMLEKLT